MMVRAAGRVWILALIVWCITAFPTRATMLLVGDGDAQAIEDEWQESYLNGAYRLRRIAYLLLAALTGTGLLLLKNDFRPEPNGPFSF